MKKILFILATHGNEQFSFKPMEDIVKKYPKKQYGYDFIIGNPKAVAQNKRYTEVDLNRSAPGNIKSNIYEEKRAAQLIALTQKYQCVIDIHGTEANCGITTIIPYPTIANLFLALLLAIKRNVVWYSKESLIKGPLVQFTKCPGIEIECGTKTSATTTKKLKKILINFFKNRSLININKLLKEIKKKEFYYVYDFQPEDGKVYSDFKLTKIGNEKFYPYISNRYPQIACYKMRKINFESLFLM